MIYPVVITASARTDLDDIGEYIRNNAGPLTADVFIRRVIRRIGSLDFAPERNALREDVVPGLRALQVQGYLVFYRIESDRVLVLRVIHGARDIIEDAFRS